MWGGGKILICMHADFPAREYRTGDDPQAFSLLLRREDAGFLGEKDLLEMTFGVSSFAPSILLLNAISIFRPQD
jgi:hypothetical protein